MRIYGAKSIFVMDFDSRLFSLVISQCSFIYF